MTASRHSPLVGPRRSPPLSQDADIEVHAEIGPTGLNHHNVPTKSA